MATKPLTVAFVGTGDTTEANVKALLDDSMPEKDSDGESIRYNPPIIPDQVRRTNKGLMRCWDWLSKEFEEGYEKLQLAEIVPALVADRDDPDEPADVYLVYVPTTADQDDPHFPVVREAIAAGIRVKDISAGLDDFELPKDKTESEKPPARTRGRARTAKVEGPEDDNPPWKEDGGAQTASKTSESSAAQEPAKGSSGSSPTDSRLSAGISVVLSQKTIDHLLSTFASLADDVKASVIPEVPADAKPKAHTYTFWVDEDGNYRERVGRGRGKKGETAVDLTLLEVEKLGLSLGDAQ